MWTRRDVLRTLALPALPFAAEAADPGTLKIARVEAHVLRIGNRKDIVCARVVTEDEFHGWGEGTSPPTVAPTLATIRSLEPLLKGESAWNIEKLWRRMYITEENTLQIDHNTEAWRRRRRNGILGRGLAGDPRGCSLRPFPLLLHPAQ